uniref:Uncharacterized protein n=1 Tax=Arundo donax TaxID=35708 RepID=A0A0A9DJM5_ARUDO
MNASISASGLIFAAFSRLDSSVSISKREPTPWQRAENARVSLTVISPMWRSCWLMYAAVLLGTNSVISCPL